MKIVVLGATGACGKSVVRQALDGGHDVIAYVRRPNTIDQKFGLRVIGGSLDDVAAMTSAFTGADAVISCIGVKLGLGSIFRADLLQTVLPKILNAVDASGTKRFVLTSAFGVGDTAKKASGLARFLYSTLTRAIFDDKAHSERSLTTSRTNWTVVYPVMLYAGSRLAKVQVTPIANVITVPGLPKVTFDNVASTLIEVAARTDLAGERLLLTA